MEPPRLDGPGVYAARLTISDREAYGNGRDILGGTPMQAVSLALRVLDAFMEETDAWFDA